jgi:hypothetical protein
MKIHFCLLIYSQKLFFLTRKLTLKIDSAASTGSHGNYSKYFSFPWLPVVAAHDRKRLAQALYTSGSYWL